MYVNEADRPRRSTGRRPTGSGSETHQISYWRGTREAVAVFTDEYLARGVALES